MSYTETDRLVEKKEFEKAKELAKYLTNFVVENAIIQSPCKCADFGNCEPYIDNFDDDFYSDMAKEILERK